MAGRGPARRWVGWAIAAAVAVVAVVAAVLVAIDRDGGARPPAAAPTTTAPGTNPAVVAVKIDNVSAARPQTGLGSADVVYVEPVEGGLTRLVAVYTRPPRVVGPVRSARRTDIELLAQYGRPVLAYSGAAPELLSALRAADIVDASPAQAPAAFHRDTSRPAPHNLYLDPADLPRGAAAPAEPPLRFGAAPPAGEATGSQEITFQAARYTFTWSAGEHRWLVSMDGTPLVCTDSGRVSAATVVRQEVVVTTTEPIQDAHGTVSPVARTVGHGAALVLRDGRRFAGTWSRPAPGSPTTFRTTGGEDLPLAAGPVWVLLTPA